jgi:hypothetical protein
MAWIEFHIKTSGDPILVNVDQIVRIGVAVDEGGGAGTPGTFIRQADGSTVEISEPYRDVGQKIKGT